MPYNKDHLMKTLGLTSKEADELMLADKAIDHIKSVKEIDADLSADQKKTVKQMRQADRVKGQPTAYKFTTRERKPNELKEAIIDEIATFLRENSSFGSDNVEITNKNRQIAFAVGDKNFELTLVEKRTKKA